MMQDRRPKQEILVGADIEKYAQMAAEQRQENKIVTEIIESLSPLEQELYRLRFMERMSLRAIARIMGWQSDNTVRHHLKKMYATVRERLEENE